MKDEGMPEPTAQSRHLKAIDLSSNSDLLPTYEGSWAVVIGINNYAHPDLKKLDNAVKDALGIADVLVTRLDFPRENVFLALDPKPDPSVAPHLLASNVGFATKADIEDLLLNVLPEKAGKNDRVLLFYAGHGEQRAVPGEKEKSGAFLIPADAVPGKWNTYVDWEMVRRAGDEFCKAKHIFYILDACYSGIVNMRDASEPSRDVRDALTNRARQALAAGTSRQVVADAGREGHSPFTWHLIQGLRGYAVDPERSTEGSVISAHDLIGYVRRKVAEEDSTEQTPSGGSIAGHGGGDFIFASPLIGFSGQEHLRLGIGLVELGLRSGEWVCFESAARNLREATRLKRMAQEDAAEAEEWLGRALLRTGSETGRTRSQSRNSML
jgi:Caspase domain